MEHIVHFGISIDDETIKKRVQENAYDDVVKKLMLEATNSIPTKWVGYNRVVQWEKILEDRLDAFIAKNKDEVINAAADKLVEHYKRTKAYKEKMGNVVEKGK